MTSASPMLMRALRRASLCAAACAACASCGPRPLTLERPVTLRDPYPERRDVVWAVAPLANESGVTAVDALAVTDELVAAIQQANGLAALPTNRTLRAMRSLGVARISTPAEARLVARTLNADGIVVGTISAWDPYDPPELGITCVLYARTPAMLAEDRASVVDPAALSRAVTDAGLVLGDGSELPVAASGGHFDAENHSVLAAIQRYATGRHDPRQALGWERFTKSMGGFTEFVCFRLVEDLLVHERRRVGALASDIEDRPA